MSLYYEAASLISGPRGGGSLKSRIYGSKQSFKSAPAQLYALLVETQKYAALLSETVEKSGILESEKKLTPLLSILLLHDHLLSKSGIAAPKNHVLREAVLRHKARVSAEFTKLRVRRGFASVEALKASIEQQWKKNDEKVRWVRVNSIKSSLKAELGSSFKAFRPVAALSEILQSEDGIYTDPNIPDLVAISTSVEITKWPAYKSGNLILQDKASCFPAYLLDPTSVKGDVIDGCAAPGNKTTHLAALSQSDSQRISAYELSPGRSRTLEGMVEKAGAASKVTVRASSDFLNALPSDPLLANVEAILLDPSCSGSGILGRDEAAAFELTLPRYSKEIAGAHPGKSKGKNKGDKARLPTPVKSLKSELEVEEPLSGDAELDATRLESLAAFQLAAILHAFSFPQVKRVSYSTCSLHTTENEEVVFQALSSKIATTSGWRLLNRHEQVQGLQSWPKRGVAEPFQSLPDPEAAAEACIRCDKGGADATGGFFVACFVRD